MQSPLFLPKGSSRTQRITRLNTGSEINDGVLEERAVLATDFVKRQISDVGFRAKVIFSVYNMELFSGSWALYAATAVALLVALTYLYLTSTHGLWQRLNVPFIKPDIIYGNMKEIAQFKKSQNEVFTEFYRHFKDSGHKFGGVWQLRDPVLIICTVDLVKDALIKNFPHFHDRHIAHDEHFDPLSAHLIALEGSKWKYIRSKLNPAFSTSKLKGMFASMRNTAGRLVEVLSEAAEQGEMMEMREFVARYTVEIIGDVAFGIQVNAMTEDSKFLLMGQKYFEPTKTERISQIISNTHPWLYKLLKLRSISKEVTEFFTGVVRKTMEYRRKNNIERNDFLHFLMKIDETSGTNLKDMEEMKGVKNYNTAVNENSIGRLLEYVNVSILKHFLLKSKV